MLKTRLNWRADRGARAIKSLAEIDASILALNDEDLLDLADIFLLNPDSPVARTASAEMARRNLAL
jgi:hypothetical protein